MATGPASPEKRMRLRRDDACRSCAVVLPAGVEAVYERATRTVRCLSCPPTTAVPEVDRASGGTAGPPVDSGVPGASARAEFERRRDRREERIRSKHPRLGGLVLALSDDPQSTTAWNVGALGEERLGRRLEELSGEHYRVLHDRRIPGTRANIDHVVVAPSGIHVIDAKRYVGKRPTLRVEGGVLRPRVERLLVGGRDRTRLVDGVLEQVEVIRSVLARAGVPTAADLPVLGVLCFVESDWPLVGGAFRTRGVDVLWPKKLYPQLRADGPLAGRVDELHRVLAAALPRA